MVPCLEAIRLADAVLLMPLPKSRAHGKSSSVRIVSATRNSAVDNNRSYCSGLDLTGLLMIARSKRVTFDG